MNRTVPSEAPGNSHSIKGPTKREVFGAEKLSDDAKEMKSIQPIRGTYLLTALRRKPRSSVVATDDMI